MDRFHFKNPYFINQMRNSGEFQAERYEFVGSVNEIMRVSAGDNSGDRDSTDVSLFIYYNYVYRKK